MIPRAGLVSLMVAVREAAAGELVFVAGSSVFGADDPAAAFTALANRVRLEPI